MTEYFSKIFNNHEPPSDLLNNILISINDEKRIHKLRIHISIMAPLLIFVCISSAYLYSLLSTTITDSGFLYYASLLFSDTNDVLLNIGSYIGLIAETAPVITFALFLTGILGVLKVSEYIFKDTKSLTRLTTHKHKTYANS